jgi:hypothetical protein
MNDPRPDSGWLQVLLLIGFIIPVIIFILTQQRTLQLIHPENRRLSPGLVWLQLIPLFGIIWQFLVISRISNSIRDELNTPTGELIFSEETVPHNTRPTYMVGISYATLLCISLLPFMLVKGIAALAGLIVWVIYWVQLSHYKKKLKARA